MKRALLLIALVLAVMLGLGDLAHADVNDFSVTSFSSEQTLSRVDKQGELRIIEKIDVVFTDQNHGIERAIPNTYKDHSLQIHIKKVSSPSGAPTQHRTYDSNDNTVLRIGDPDRTVTGSQSYIIEYMVSNVITFYDEYDELYWDVNGDQWKQPFTKVSVKLTFPEDLQQSKTPVCYTGEFGSAAQLCTIVTEGDTIEAKTTGALAPNQTLTYVAGFTKGYFLPSTTSEEVSQYWPQLIGFFSLITLVGGGSFLF